MTENRTIARPYARSAFEFAASSGAVDSWSDALARLAAIVRDPEARALIHHPRVTEAQLVETVLAVGQGAFTGPLENFVRVLVEADRLEVAPQVSELFEEQKAAAAGVSAVTVSTAYPLDDSARTSLEDAIRRHLGRSISVDVTEDPSLLGGAVIRTGDRVIDLSVRGRVTSLKNQLTK